MLSVRAAGEPFPRIRFMSLRVRKLCSGSAVLHPSNLIFAKRNQVFSSMVLWLAILFLSQSVAGVKAFEVPLDARGLGYTNYRVADVPWSIHVVQVARSNGLYELHSVHAGNAALGLDTLSDQ